MEELQTPITQEVWRNLKQGGGIKDSHGRIWRVTSRDPQGNPDRLFAVLSSGRQERLEWHKGKIFDEFEAVVLELNMPSVVIV